LYNEREIGAILKRTAELSKRATPPNADGLTLQEIQSLAEEAGLDPVLVSRAAAELAVSPVAPAKRDLFGGPLAYSTDIDLGVEVDNETWEMMLSTIRAHFDDPGAVQSREGILEWTKGGMDFSKKAQVSIRKRNGGSRLSIFWSEKASAIPFFIPTMLSVILSLPILFEELELGLIGIPIYVAIVATFFTLSRLGVITAKKHHVKKIDGLGQELARIALERELSAPAAQRIAKPAGVSATSRGDARAARLEIPESEDTDSESNPSDSPRERDRS
jgi:hypothetical protein